MKILLFYITTAIIGISIGAYIYRDYNPETSNPNRPTRDYYRQPQFKVDTIHLARATTYQATIAQCDSSPFTTADGSHIDPDNYQRWVALSRDLLTRWGGRFDYGDTLDIYSKDHPNINGLWVIHDCMAPSYKLSIDFLMEPEKNYPKLGVGTDVKIIFCYGDSENVTGL
jgi:hypothetical protein